MVSVMSRDPYSWLYNHGESPSGELAEQATKAAVLGVALSKPPGHSCCFAISQRQPRIWRSKIDLEWPGFFILQTQKMGTLMAGRPVHTGLPRRRWHTDSLIQSNSWSSSPSSLLDLSVVLPRFHYIQVPHVRQMYNWDCGLACVLMVLRAVGIDGCDLKSLGKLCSTTSIWTIDLAHLLRRFAVNVAFLTVTIGANPCFAVESFYQENMEEDGERVNRLFEQAPQVGIEVQWRSISGDELCMLILSGRYLAIALVDKRKLSHPWLDDICLAECCGANSGYTGHYVVICGYDLETDEFEIRDPASSSGTGRISLDALDEARRSFGTDEDILLVSVDNFDADTSVMEILSPNSPSISI